MTELEKFLQWMASRFLFLSRGAMGLPSPRISVWPFREDSKLHETTDEEKDAINDANADVVE